MNSDFKTEAKINIDNFPDNFTSLAEAMEVAVKKKISPEPLSFAFQAMQRTKRLSRFWNREHRTIYQRAQVNLIQEMVAFMTTCKKQFPESIRNTENLLFFSDFLINRLKFKCEMIGQLDMSALQPTEIDLVARWSKDFHVPLIVTYLPDSVIIDTIVNLLEGTAIKIDPNWQELQRRKKFRMQAIIAMEKNN